MKKNVFLALVLSLSLFTPPLLAEQSIDPEILAEKINTAITDFGENINIGIFVQDAQTGKVLYKKDVDRYFMPASNQKLFTAFASLRALGPEYSYHTQLFADYKKIKNSSLKDNIYLQFSGDPTFTVPQFESLIDSLAEAGIRHIKGQAIIDDSAFDQMTISPGSSWDDQDFCWGSPVSSLIVNHNCVTATLSPADKAGDPAKLELPDYPQTMHFVNEVLTGSEEAKNCQIKARRTSPSQYTLSGCIKEKAKAQVIEMAIKNPQENIRSLLSYLLKKNQISLAGSIEFKKFEAFPKAFARQDSPPLKNMVATMLKESDNTIADALFKTMGADFAHEAGSYANGNKAVRATLASTIELQLPKTTIIDGSGASRYNFLQPEQIVSLLQKIFRSPEGPDFKNSLAIAGVDGTLKDRLNGPETKGKIFAKTGSETAVTSLSGFVETKNKEILIFSIMINGYTNPSAKYKALEDKICKILVEIG